MKATLKNTHRGVLPACMFVCHMHIVLVEARKGCQIPWNQSYGLHYEPPCRYWESNLGPLDICQCFDLLSHFSGPSCCSLSICRVLICVYYLQPSQKPSQVGSDICIVQVRTQSQKGLETRLPHTAGLGQSAHTYLKLYAPQICQVSCRKTRQFPLGY